VRRFVAAGCAVLLAVLAVPLWTAGPAAALVCSPGSTLWGGNVCIDNLTGIATGRANPIVTPTPLQAPSSALAAANGTGGTPSQNIGGATVNGLDGGGKMRLMARLGNTLNVVAAAAAGYYLGQTAASVSCSLGVAALCIPHEATGYTPNGDAFTDPQGWVGAIPPWSGFGGGGATGWTVTQGVSFTTAAYPYNGLLGADTRTGLTISATVGGASMSANASFNATAHCVNGGNPWTSSMWDYAASSSFSVPGNYNLTGAQLGHNDGNGGVCVNTGAQFRYIDNVTLNNLGGTWPTITATWYPVGSPSRPSAPTNGNPSRTWRVTNICHPVTGADTSQVATSAAFTETDTTLPAWPTPALCPTGSVLAGVSVVETGTGLPDKNIWNVTTPTAVKNWLTTYPQCGTGSCRLGLTKIGPAGSDVGDCFASSTRCEGWFQDATKAADYQCTYGLPTAPVNVALTECYVYSPTFSAQPQAQGQAYGDPATGTVTDVGDGVADPAPGGLPGSGSGGCFPTGWGVFNPAAWVLQPIKCALVWAFVPDTATMTSLTDSATTSLNASGVGAWFTALGTLFGSLGGSGSGCTGPTVVFPITSTTLQPFNACSTPMSTVAGISYAFSTVLIVVFGAMAGIRALGSAFGFHVGIGDRIKASVG